MSKIKKITQWRVEIKYLHRIQRLQNTEYRKKTNVKQGIQNSDLRIESTGFRI